MTDRVEEVSAQANAELQKITSIEELESWRVLYLGRKSKLIGILRSLGNVPIDERRELGARANQVKSYLEELYQSHKEKIELSKHESLELDRIDVTLPGRPYQLGRLHLTTRTIREICDIFAGMGFKVAEGPEVEWEYYNFEALNMPAEHPARDGFATL
jgi:phenylalanyl-tRNA synthetase alpha chain